MFILAVVPNSRYQNNVDALALSLSLSLQLSNSTLN